MPDIDPCKDEKEESDESLEDFRHASEDRDQAREDLEDAESLFDGSTWASGGAIIGIGLACVSNPFSWVICGLGMGAGGAALFGSETDRADDIKDAKNALQRAERDYWKANARFQRAMRKEMHCRHHNQLTGQPA
jgi:hypothetical protein